MINKKKKRGNRHRVTRPNYILLVVGYSVEITPNTIAVPLLQYKLKLSYDNNYTECE